MGRRRRGFYDSWDAPRDERAYFDQAAICRECGKVASALATTTEFPIEQRCTACGGAIIRQCEGCGVEIRGKRHVPGVVDLTRWKGPGSFCHQCGEAYPWAKTEQPASVEVPPLDRLLHLLDRFHAVARRLKKRHGDRETLKINDEYDVQDLLEALLEIDFEDVRPEEWNPSHGGKSTRTDFFLAVGGIAIEVKKTRKGLKDSQLFDELVADVARYQQRADYRQLVCFIYDPDELVNRAPRLVRDLEALSSEALEVIAVIVPRR